MIAPGKRLISHCAAFVALLGLAAPALAVMPAHAAAKTPTWLVNNAATRTVTLTVIAGYGGGFDFNGHSNGKMTVTVPVGDHVVILFSNQAPLAHSLVITAYANRMAASAITDAFKGANSPNPTRGTVLGTKQKISFVAGKVGTYAMVCAVPGHAAGGMWDVFKVVKAGRPGITIAK